MGKLVTINKPFTGVVLIPGMRGIDAGQTYTLTDAEYAGLSAALTRTVTLTTSGLPDPVRGATAAPSSLQDVLTAAEAYTDTAGTASTTTIVLAGAGTIPTAGLGNVHVAPAGNVGLIVLQAGTVNGDRVTVINESTSTITFNSAGTSHVAAGVTVMSGLTAREFVWDSPTSLWYHLA